MRFSPRAPSAANRARFLATLLVAGALFPPFVAADPALCNAVVALPCERWSVDLGNLWTFDEFRAKGAGGLVFVSYVTGTPPHEFTEEGGPTKLAAFTEDGTQQWAFDTDLYGVELAPSANGALLLLLGHTVDAENKFAYHALEARQGTTGERLWRIALPTLAVILVSPDASAAYAVWEEAPCGRPECISTIVESYDPLTGIVNWKTKLNVPSRGAILSPESGRVYVLTNPASWLTKYVLHSVEAVTGRVLSQRTLTGVEGDLWLRSGLYGSPATAAVSTDGARIFILEQRIVFASGRVAVLAFSTTTGDLLWRSQQLQSDWRHLTFMPDTTGTRAVLVTRSEILTVSTDSGTTERVVSTHPYPWDAQTQSRPWAAVATAGGKQLGLAYLAPVQGNSYVDNVAVYDLENGSFGWRASVRELPRFDFQFTDLAGSMTSGRLFMPGFQYDNVCFQTQLCGHQRGRLIGFGT